MTVLADTVQPGISPQEYAALLRHDLVAFIQLAFHELNPEATFLPAKFIELMVFHLEECRAGRIKRLIINLPPRSLKSHCVSIAFVAWLLGHDATAQIICASYGQDLADKLARDCRRVIETDWYKALFATRLSIRRAVNDFTTTKLGVRMATSVGGVLTGRGADFIIIDDPTKPDQAMSETGRKAANEWFDNTLLTRLNNKVTGCIIIVMQRLHQDDLVGHVLQQGDWTFLSFPAIAEQDERVAFSGPYGQVIFSRKAGEALHPEREGLVELGRMRQAMGHYNFASQYQQTPISVEGNVVKRSWLRFFDEGEEPAQGGYIVQSWDTANKATELNDYSVCTTWVVAHDHFYLVDVYRERLNYPELKRAVMTLAARFNPQTILIEDKASGTQLIQDLLNDGMYQVIAYKPPPGTDKIIRLHAQSAVFENGHVHLPAEAPWLDDYIAELTGVPGTRHDDQVDSTTQALNHIRSDNTLQTWIRIGRMS